MFDRMVGCWVLRDKNVASFTGAQDGLFLSLFFRSFLAVAWV